MSKRKAAEEAEAVIAKKLVVEPLDPMDVSRRKSISDSTSRAPTARSVPYVCTTEDCGKSFLTATRLRRHQEVHAGQNRFRCRDYPPCDQSFRKHNTLQRHIRAEHQGGPAYLCPEQGCHAGFDSQGALRNHTKRDHSEPSFWCDECELEADPSGDRPPRRCKGQAELERHVELYHSGIPLEARKTIPCAWPGCDKKFTKKSNLNAHVRSAHEGLRFVCGQAEHATTADLAAWPREQGCGTAFVTKGNLEAHIRHVHLGIERPVPAPLADRDDDDVGTAAAHQKRRRTTTTVMDQVAGTDRSIACTMPHCTERFFRAHDLDLHLAHHPPSPIEAEVLRLGTEASADDTSATAQPQQQDNVADRPMPELPFLGVSQEIVYRDEADPVIRVPQDDDFWIGAGDAFGLDAAAVPETAGQQDVTWQHDEAAMRALIDEDFSRFIDPALGEGMFAME
ncbi:zinc finger protein [Verticillium alfalfae VaMs.102]|uniref:Zinc finger protein n=1 Tax=Verticillium alfalfae (strain VaMs.102 / ATCC MYA-4576 / FGSC 10136) TaxID=526221 RepID=C9SV65_VERA1|nr:zinc finger protein [Verticillium alfalfae VaMs.102]EEY22680.1 zinc finger protein [Verticillium alfalfae VaMs.102]